MKKLTLALFAFYSIQSFAFDCGFDTLISHIPEIQNQTCTTAGYCTKYAYNPETGLYENFYGFHPDCNGVQERTVDRYTCQRADFTTYEKQNEGVWGFCQIR